jgi:outer membrane receptor protein involved in Fe transport
MNVRALLCLGFLLFTVGLEPVCAADPTANFDIPSQSLATALQEFAAQTGLQVAVETSLTTGKQAPAVKGQLSKQDVLERLLQGTGLVYRFLDNRTVAVAASDKISLLDRVRFMDASIRLAQADSGTSTQGPATTQAAPTGGEPQSSGSLEEISVSGTRIVRDGYQSPTPVSVLGENELQLQAVTSVADALNRMPEFSGSTITNGNGASYGGNTGGANSLNLRGLQPTRTLVLIDGERLVGSNFSGFNNDASAVDINVIPDNLIKRVDVVTGGASAVYGSDALAGVVNFVLDKNFTGIKGDVQGNVTTYGDDPGGRMALAIGEPFADERGHVLLSAEYFYQAGLEHTDRPWAQTGYSILANPAYAPGNGLPEYESVYNTGSALSTPGGLITSGPLKGTAFGAGGRPYTFNYGPLVSGALMSGGDSQISRFDNLDSLDFNQQRENFFGRVSYDILDNVTAFAEAGWAYEHAISLYGVSYFHLGNVTIQSGNPFIPAPVQAQMTAQGINSFTLGTTNADESTGFSPDNARTFERYVGGLEGKFDILGATWNWKAYVEHSQTHVTATVPNDEIESNYSLAVDAVVSPTTGQIVCRSSLTNPNNGCVPYNPMGTGVNSQAALNYIQGTGYTRVDLNQNVQEFSATGTPFSLWAGPVAFALDYAHREEETTSYSTPLDQEAAYFAGNFSESAGEYAVTEGALETDVPLAKDMLMAKALDINAAIRFTDYSTSGYVSTWKIGSSYKPVDDVTFRVTQSRDIRAPTLSDLYNAGNSGGTNVIENGVTEFVAQRIEGNPDLQPEKADSTGVGLVLTPTFLPGFGASIDYYNIKIKGAIVALTAQNYVDLCDEGNTEYCSFIERNAAGTISTVLVKPANFQEQSERGVDFEMSYNFALSDLMSSLPGHLTFRALATYIDSLETVGDGVTVQGAGVLGGFAGVGTTGLTAPRWKYTATMVYDQNDFEGSLMLRGTGEGVYSSELIQCSTNCPTATAANGTINNNHIGSWTATDLALSYRVFDGGQFYLTVQNLFNLAPPAIATGGGGAVYTGQENAAYDQLGRVFRAGFRFKY